MSEDLKTIGLIEGYEVSISVGTKKIHIYAKTNGSYVMNKIGINNIHIQRSSDNVSFSDEKTASADYAYNGSISESQSNTSNSVWIA